MGYRYRNSLRLGKGVRLNIGKKSASLTLGVPGMSVNIGKRGVRATTGIPGTGISYSHKLNGNQPQMAPNANSKPLSLGKVLVIIFIIYFLYCAISYN